MMTCPECSGPMTGAHTVWIGRGGYHYRVCTPCYRRANLRAIPLKANRQNRRVRSDSRTGIRGVERREYKGRVYFTARSYEHGKSKHLGNFTTAEAAGAAVQASRRVHMPLSKE